MGSTSIHPIPGQTPACCRLNRPRAGILPKALWHSGCVVLILLGAVPRAGAYSLSTFPTPTPNSHVQDITTGPDGNLWFTESGVGKIGRITTSGVITEFAGANGPYDITSGADGRLWFTEPGPGKIGQITTGGVITEFTASGSPLSIASGSDGNVWFTYPDSDKIGRMTPSWVLWNKSDGTAGLWFLGPKNLYQTSFGYGPYQGFTPPSLLRGGVLSTNLNLKGGK